MQYESLSQSFITLFIYLVPAENYIEASTTAYEQNLLNYLFFISCSFVGLFFVTSLFIEAFSASFTSNREIMYTAKRQQEWSSLLVVMEIWLRHSHETCAYFDGKQRRAQSTEFIDYIESGMSFDSTMDLIMAQRHALSNTPFGEYNQVLQAAPHLLSDVPLLGV